MDKELTELLDKQLPLNFDKRLVKELKKFRIEWSQKSPIYINFLSTGLTGVYPIRFSSIDEDNFYRILRGDARRLEKMIHSLDGIETVNRVVSSNSTYLILIYLMHKFHNIKDKGLGLSGIMECFYILSFKMLGSMFFRFFKYPTPMSVAKAVYEKMNQRYIIKKEGTWQNVIIRRSKDISEGTYKERVKRLETEVAGKVAAAVHGSYKSMLIYVYSLIEEVKLGDSYISTTSIVEKIEDEVKIRDDINMSNKHIEYLKDAISKKDLIDNELTYLITYVSRNISQDMLEMVLEEYIKSYNAKTDTYTEHIIENSFKYLMLKGVKNPKQDLITTLKLLRGYWSSGNSDNKVLKEDIKKLCYKGIRKKTNWLLSSLTISFILYIFLRSIVEK